MAAFAVAAFQAPLLAWWAAVNGKPHAGREPFGARGASKRQVTTCLAARASACSSRGPGSEIRDALPEGGK